MRAFRSFILATGLVIASSAAHAAVRVYIAAGPSAPAYYNTYGNAAYYDAYGNYYPGQWVAVQGRHDREWREHEWREHEWREHRDGERDRERRGDGYRDGRRDRDDRGSDRDDRHHGRDEDR